MELDFDYKILKIKDVSKVFILYPTLLHNDFHSFPYTVNQIEKILNGLKKDEKIYFLDSLYEIFMKYSEARIGDVIFVDEEGRERVKTPFHPPVHHLVKWLKNELHKINNSGLKSAKDQDIYHGEQMLILHYLGLLKNEHLLPVTTENQAKLISSLLLRNEENTRQFLTYFGTKKNLDFKHNKKYLKRVYDLFIKFKMKELANKVKEDLEKLNQTE